MKTLIVGGGLSGLALAEMLETQGRDYLLVEARTRFGGRIMTQDHEGGYFDLGPAWFWPGQPRIASLTQRLGLTCIDQFTDGALMYEDERGQVRRVQGFSSMPESWRLQGGLATLTNALANRLSDDRIRLGAAVTLLDRTGGSINATLTDGRVFSADQVVLALPPRIAAQITFSPALPASAMQAMRNIATWMAGQSKAIAIYRTTFWRDAGLSGNALSRVGPMVEIHDASPAEGGLSALFGFLGVPPQSRRDERALRQQLLSQLVKLFGPQAAKPEQVFIKDWAFDPFTATDADQAPLYAHPTYGLPHEMTDLWHNKLLFAGTEVASNFGGYLEGALEAAENVLPKLSG